MKCLCSTVGQLVIDETYVIRGVFDRLACSIHCAYVYSASSFKTCVDNIIHLSCYLIGDSAYSTSDRLATQFNGELIRDQEIYNTKI